MKRRLAKGRAQLTAAERAFLDGLPFPQDDEYYGDKNADGWYGFWITHCHLTSPWRDDRPPGGGASAADLWDAYGLDVTREWIERYPGTRPRPWWRFSAPVEREDGESEVEYLRRHHLLTPRELSLLKVRPRRR